MNQGVYCQQKYKGYQHPGLPDRAVYPHTAVEFFLSDCSQRSEYDIHHYKDHNELKHLALSQRDQKQSDAMFHC